MSGPPLYAWTRYDCVSLSTVYLETRPEGTPPIGLSVLAMDHLILIKFVRLGTRPIAAILHYGTDCEVPCQIKTHPTVRAVGIDPATCRLHINRSTI